MLNVKSTNVNRSTMQLDNMIKMRLVNGLISRLKSVNRPITMNDGHRMTDIVCRSANPTFQVISS